MLLWIHSNIARARTTRYECNVCELYIVACAIAAVAGVLNAGFSTSSRTCHNLLLNGV